MALLCFLSFCPSGADRRWARRLASHLSIMLGIIHRALYHRHCGSCFLLIFCFLLDTTIPVYLILRLSSCATSAV